MKKVKTLKQAAENSIGLTTGKMARQEIRYLIDQYKVLEKRLIVLEAQLEELVLHVPGAKKMTEIKGVRLLTVTGFFAEEGGELRHYKGPAGLNLKMNQPCLFKGKTTITKRGRKGYVACYIKWHARCLFTMMDSVNYMSIIAIVPLIPSQGNNRLLHLLEG